MACNYTERTFNLPDGTEYSYNDGGPVPGSIDYTTLVTIHGSGFNGASFVHMHEYAHQRNLRLINVNRRGYRGSTKFSDTDLDDFGGGRQVYHHKLALQLSQFLEHLVLVENIPPPDMNRKSGGIVFLGWSFGNATSMTLLSDPDAIPRSVYETIEPYLLSVVLYDPPYVALGYPDPDHEVYHPWKDTASSPEERSKNFMRWVSSYYTHPPITSSNYDSSTLDFRSGTDKHTSRQWSPQQLEDWFEGPISIHTDGPGFTPESRKALARQLDGVVYDEVNASTFFPRVNLIHVTGAQTLWDCMWGYITSQERYNKTIARGGKPRPTQFYLIEGANHFLHWDNPDALFQCVVDGMRK
jgi:pimeloyl-ACP methyl ester carboxylesterase